MGEAKISIESLTAGKVFSLSVQSLFNMLAASLREIILMSTYLLIISIALGLAVLTWGADLFVKAASNLAHDFGIPPLVIGLTVVAFGTSAPELAVNLIAVFQGNTNIASGNVVGSNILNVAVILGICALIAPLKMDKKLIRVEMPIMVVLSLLFWWMAMDRRLVFWEGLLLSSGILIYLGIQIRSTHNTAALAANAPISDQRSRLIDILKISLGLGMLLGGAKVFVDGAVAGARLLGWSETLISLTIVAAGTSLPEFATSVIATYRGEREIAVGNVVGSNIFNILTVLGISSLVMDIKISRKLLLIDLPYMTGLAIFCLLVVLHQKKIGRGPGLCLLVSYFGYMAYRQM
jgi:cation:H+ antiporter